MYFNTVIRKLRDVVGGNTTTVIRLENEGRAKGLVTGRVMGQRERDVDNSERRIMTRGEKRMSGRGHGTDGDGGSTGSERDVGVNTNGMAITKAVIHESDGDGWR